MTDKIKLPYCFDEDESRRILLELCKERDLDEQLIREVCEIELSYEGSGRADGVVEDIQRAIEAMIVRKKNRSTWD